MSELSTWRPCECLWICCRNNSVLKQEDCTNNGHAASQQGPRVQCRRPLPRPPQPHHLLAPPRPVVPSRHPLSTTYTRLKNDKGDNKQKRQQNKSDNNCLQCAALRAILICAPPAPISRGTQPPATGSLLPHTRSTSAPAHLSVQRCAVWQVQLELEDLGVEHGGQQAAQGRQQLQHQQQARGNLGRRVRKGGGFELL